MDQSRPGARRLVQPLITDCCHNGSLDHAISGLLDNEPLREKYARIGRERILDRFSWRQAAEEMTRLYRGVIAGYGE